MTSRFVPALLVFLMLAGCLSGNDRPAPGQSPSSSSSSNSDSSSESTGISDSPPSDGNVSQVLALDGCGKGLIAVIYAPQALYPNAVPHEASWAADSPVLVMTVQVQECARISVGPFERGPVHLLLEMHDNLVAPASCREVPGDYTMDNALSQLWLDDAEIVAYLQTTYGLPIRFGSINITQENIGPETRDHWSFGVPGEPVSTLESTIGATDATSFPVYRLYYAPSKGRVAFMDLAENVKFEGLRNPFSTGKLAPPLLYAATGPGDVVAYGGPSRDGHYSAEVHQFGDDQCKEPL